jgi:chloramphenicol-sensitive protein RarD
VQLIIGIWVYHEAFTSARLLSFGFIWAALALYTFDNLWAQRRPVAS